MEYTVCYEDGHFMLVSASSTNSQALHQGDTLEVFQYGGFQPVTVCSGGYHGWYYVTTDGQPARFAIGMRAQNYRATCANI